MQKLHVTGASKRLAIGDRIALAYTAVGQDRFRIANSAFLQLAEK